MSLLLVPLALAGAPEVRTSATLDALLLLNALSTDGPFAQLYPSEKERWTSVFVGSGVEGLPAGLLGEGGACIQAYADHIDRPLAALPSVVRSRGRGRLLAAVEEEAYDASVPALVDGRTGLASALSRLEAGGFEAWWQADVQPELDREAAAVRTELERADWTEVERLLRPFIGHHREETTIYLAWFSRPYAMTLPRGDLLLAAGTPAAEVWTLVLHERLHAYAPGDSVLAAYTGLTTQPFVGERQRALREVHREGAEEELIVAAALYATERLGLRTYDQLRRQSILQYGGVPVAELLYERLRVDPPADYESWLRTTLPTLAALDIAASWRAAVFPVAGTVGMALEARDGALVVGRVVAGGPAASAGVEVGDRLIAIDSVPAPGDVAAAVDRMVGPPGGAVTLRFARGEQQLERALTRSALSGLPPG